MAKRTATESANAEDESQKFPRASGSGIPRDTHTNGEMGEFEDAFEDEIESDEDVVDADGDNNDGENDGEPYLDLPLRPKLTYFLRNGRRRSASCHRRV